MLGNTLKQGEGTYVRLLGKLAVMDVCKAAHSVTIPSARAGRLPLRMASVVMLTRTSCSP